MNKFDKEGLTSNKVISDVITTSDGQLYLTSDAADSRYMPIDAEVGGSFSPKDFKKLCRRMELPDDENWILWTDEGNIAYMNFNDKIVDGTELFQFKTGITIFDFDLPNLTNGSYMFRETSLALFTSDLSSLTNGSSMFNGCYGLILFTSDLSSLTNGSSMFYGCKLNKESVINIINCLKNSNTCSVAASLTLGIDASLKTDTELQTLLGITEDATSTTLVGHGGGTWTIELGWN